MVVVALPRGPLWVPVHPSLVRWWQVVLALLCRVPAGGRRALRVSTILLMEAGLCPRLLWGCDCGCRCCGGCTHVRCSCCGRFGSSRERFKVPLRPGTSTRAVRADKRRKRRRPRGHSSLPVRAHSLHATCHSTDTSAALFHMHVTSVRSILPVR